MKYLNQTRRRFFLDTAARLGSIALTQPKLSRDQRERSTHLNRDRRL
jgi:hypothetical protein